MLSSLLAFYQSSIGKKILVALTGAVLVIFLLGHMIGNLLIFAGPHAINEYGHNAAHGAARCGSLDRPRWHLRQHHPATWC